MLAVVKKYKAKLYLNTTLQLFLSIVGGTSNIGVTSNAGGTSNNTKKLLEVNLYYLRRSLKNQTYPHIIETL